MNEQAKCGLCGEPMPPGEEMFQYHGCSGPCPKPPTPRDEIHRLRDELAETQQEAASLRNETATANLALLAERAAHTATRRDRLTRMESVVKALAAISELSGEEALAKFLAVRQVAIDTLTNENANDAGAT